MDTKISGRGNALELGFCDVFKIKPKLTSCGDKPISVVGYVYLRLSVTMPSGKTET